ncbi:MAG: hypothetical protein KGM18_07450 [Sphingomonadales bacterium]|nr:hypothetical protein [Sphingomonadales bacterium]
MQELTRGEMEAILLAHGMAELRFDVVETMQTVVPVPHYEIVFLDLAIDGWDAVVEMYRRLLAGNRNRDFQVKVRVDTAGRNTLMQEAHVSFKNLKGERVAGIYLSVVEFDPERRQIIGERMYGDAVWAQMWRENLGADIAGIAGVSKLSDIVPEFDPLGTFGETLGSQV